MPNPELEIVEIFSDPNGNVGETLFLVKYMNFVAFPPLTYYFVHANFSQAYSDGSCTLFLSTERLI